MKVTGHSTRRSGALQYIRQGWAVPHVGYLGRWKSNVILQYAEEALETIAANTPGRFGKPPDAPNVEKVQPLSTVLKPDPDTGPKIDNEAIIAQIKADISKLKNGTKVLTKDFNDAVEDLKSKMESAQKFLPKYVISHLPPISSDAHQQTGSCCRPRQLNGGQSAGGTTTAPPINLRRWSCSELHEVQRDRAMQGGGKGFQLALHKILC